METKERIREVFLVEKDFCLHFDGKKMKNVEYQVVCVQNPQREIKLGIVQCTSGHSQHIYEKIKAVLDDYEAWGSIQMIVCDTTSVNTGRINGVVVRIQKEMVKRGFPMPQYVGCQHHILDRVLKHTLDFFVDNRSQNPSLNYEFIDEIVQNYAHLQELYQGEIAVPQSENPGWRDDFRFLFELCKAFRLYKVGKNFNSLLYM
jgi:hypothetical protein